MKQILKPLKNTLLSSAVAATLLASSLSADCTYQLFTISSIKGTQIGEFVNQLSDECSFTVIVTDPEAEKLFSDCLLAPPAWGFHHHSFCKGNHRILKGI